MDFFVKKSGSKLMDVGEMDFKISSQESLHVL